jgi:BlaI family transcriptional regulator, penicillinase repressor
MATRGPAPITDAELRVMEELWNLGQASIRDLRDALYPDGGASKFATVQKLLSRLAAKRLVRRRKDEAIWVFRATIGRDELIGGELRRVADRLGGASLTPLLTHLIEAGDLTAQDRARLRRLLDEPEDKRRGRKESDS